MKKNVTIGAACAIALLSVAAAYAADGVDESNLFGDDSGGIETVDQGEKGKAVSTFLKSEAVRIGGSFTGTLTPSWTWTNPWNGNFDATKPDTMLLTPSVAGKLYFDARPNEDTRFYGAVKTQWPFTTTQSFLTGATYVPATSSVTTSSGSVSLPNISVFELFADRTWNDTLFFRFGKHTVKWGVGYFWSPADVINLTQIDVTDPTAQREGPISLRVLAPIKGTQNNIWAYAILPNVTSANASSLQPADVAVAAKYEFLVGNCEIGLGGFYQRDLAPKAMLTATGSVWKFNLFGEGVVSKGSDKAWASITNAGVTTSKNKDDPYFSGTAGFSYVDSTNDVTAYLQYFYNGNGYANADRKDLISKAHALIASYQAQSPSAATSMSTALKGLIYQSGQHYVGGFVQKSDLLNDRLTLSLLAIANAADLSGMLQPAAAFEFFDGVSLTLNPTFVWTTSALWGAGDDGEYAILYGGPTVTLSVKATLGTGTF